MPPKAGRGRGKKLKRTAEENKVQENTQDNRGRKIQERSLDDSPLPSERSPQQSPEPQKSPSPPPLRYRDPGSSDYEDDSALPPGRYRPGVGKGKGDKRKGKAHNANQAPIAPYSLSETQEEEIAGWIENKGLLYDMKDRQYKDKALKRQLWEGKAVEYGIDYDTILKWYHTQRTRFSRLREGQPKKKSTKRSGDGLSSGDEEDTIIVEEAGENDSDRDKFIRRVFGFLKAHIRRHKKDTPTSFKDKLALAETGEMAGSDESTMTGSIADEPREPTKKYTGYPTPRLPSRTRKTAESPTMEMKVTGASLDLQDKLVQFILPCG